LANYWKDLYSEASLFGVIHQERHRRALAWLSELALPEGSRILELGCGAGIQAIAFAECGYIVHGVDSADAMVELATESAKERGVSDRVSFVQGDAHHLPYDDATFDLVTALGLLPYLYDPPIAIREMSRVLKPNGRLLISSHNVYRLSQLLDPRFSAVFSPLKELVRGMTGERFRHVTPVRTYSLKSLRSLLADSSFSTERWQSFGFGPFSFLGRELLSEPRSVALHGRLQSLADRGTPILRNTGNQHLVLAQLSS
jgi:ubiquinone/menaquinone biosynthesis C-methylase UbiE